MCPSTRVILCKFISSYLKLAVALRALLFAFAAAARCLACRFLAGCLWGETIRPLFGRTPATVRRCTGERQTTAEAGSWHIRICGLQEGIHAFVGCRWAYMHLWAAGGHIRICGLQEGIYAFVGCRRAYMHLWAAGGHICICGLRAGIHAFVGCRGLQVRLCCHLASWFGLAWAYFPPGNSVSRSRKNEDLSAAVSSPSDEAGDGLSPRCTGSVAVTAASARPSPKSMKNRPSSDPPSPSNSSP